MKKDAIEMKGSVSPETAISLLKDLAASFAKGTVCVQAGEDFVTLAPAGPIEIEVEAKEKKDKQKIEISLSWRTVLPVEEGEAPVKIMSEEPEIVEPIQPLPTEEVVKALVDDKDVPAKPEPKEVAKPAPKEVAKAAAKSEPKSETKPKAKAVPKKVAPKKAGK